jgi:hypothetical protein
MPFLQQLAPLLRRDFPRAWSRYLSAMNAPESLAELNAMASKPVIPVEQIIASVVKTPEISEVDEVAQEELSEDMSAAAGNGAAPANDARG